MKTNRHVWEGWTVQDFINELDIPFSYQKKFKTKEDLKRWCRDNQPYYKKNIPEVVEYYWSENILKLKNHGTVL